MTFKKLNLQGVFEIELEAHQDERGFFMRVYDDKAFQMQGLKTRWVEESVSFSLKKGTIRGLHFQRPPFAEAKLVSVFRGEAFFVFVDLRKNSSTFGQWGSIILSEENKKRIFLPRGLALGMCALSDNCLLHYKIDNYFTPASAETIKWNDEDLKIEWPVKEPSVISERDKNGKSFKEFINTYGGLEV